MELGAFKNVLTFNPGWDSNAQKFEGFTDVRELQRITVDARARRAAG
jgi:hypothetical protein